MSDLDPIVARVCEDLYDHFADLDDQEDAPFGEYARVISVGGRLVVAHQSDSSVQVEILVRRLGTPGPSELTEEALATSVQANCAARGYTSHGWPITGLGQSVVPPPARAKCGGPALCPYCRAEADAALGYLEQMRQA